ncbi:DUF1176 domain-containing protein [Sphingomonas sp.]|uniref:DUF1176 domain-containing protein n=1 Tax=Sphingomonas sp. TaxID=28214 RepID=UPI001ED0B6D9|nr:DUF1176 domain-containing protein [Sphingomonas sp.]MBX3594944.1 DUF1176 domain-containing protein [Sphingomonas sp.]
MTMIFLLLAQAAAPAVGEVRVFGDWAVACDNVRRCEMTSLQPERAEDTDGWQLSATRDAGPAGGWTVRLIGQDATAGTGVRIEGARGAAAAKFWKGDRFDGDDAAAIAAALVDGRAAIISRSTATPAGRVSLAGSAAALRYIDAQQGRAGTVTAIVARGDGPATDVPSRQPWPRVPAIAPAGNAGLPPAITAVLWKRSACGENYPDGQRPAIQSHAVGGGAVLALVPCGAGAYNLLSEAFIVRAGQAAAAAFDSPPGFGEEGDDMPVNADFDAKTGRLTSYAKGRGLGDCGTSQSYVWDGSRFRLVEARVMSECRGSVNWLIVWKAQPVRE